MFSRGKGGKTSTVTSRAADRTVVFPVVGQAQEEPQASARRFDDEFVERDEEALVVNPGRGLQAPLALPPLVVERPHSDDVQLQGLGLVEHLVDPRVLVRAILCARGVREVVAVCARDAEGRAVLEDEPTAVRGDELPLQELGV